MVTWLNVCVVSDGDCLLYISCWKLVLFGGVVVTYGRWLRGWISVVAVLVLSG